MKKISLALLTLTLSTSAFAWDNLDITCQTLGDVGQCTNVSICHERQQGACRANPGFGAPRGMTADQFCGIWSASADACQRGQPNNCHWDDATMCVPLRR